MLCGKQITVNIVPGGTENTRIPTSHTCGCILNLPSSYATYIDFRSEFLAVLSSDVWVMDFQ